jgi:anti-sigma B factor antagonist
MTVRQIGKHSRLPEAAVATLPAALLRSSPILQAEMRGQPQAAATGVSTMQLQLGEAGDGFLNIALIGRLDTPGVDRIEAELTAYLVRRGTRATIDLSRVAFISSAGIRMFITIARALDRNGGRMALYGARPLVAQVFETVSLNNIVPVRADASAAESVVRA